MLYTLVVTHTDPAAPLCGVRHPASAELAEVERDLLTLLGYTVAVVGRA